MADWKVILCDRRGVPLQDITSLAYGKKYAERLNAPTSFSFRVDPDNNKISGLHSDGSPYLDYIHRTVKAYRFENNLWEHRFTGYVWPIQDDGGEETQESTVTCFDPLHIMAYRFVRDLVGSFMVVQFNALDAGVLLKTIVDRTNSFAGPSGLITAGGSFQTISNVSVEWRTKLISEALGELTTGLDIRVDPNDSENYEHGILSVMQKRGSQRTVELSWRTSPSNVSGITRIMDPREAANVVVGIGGGSQGSDQLTTTAVDPTNVGKYMQLEGLAQFSDVTDQTYLNQLVTAELLRREPTSQSVAVAQILQDALQPWKDFETGDTLVVNADPALRGGIYQVPMRIYGFSLDIDDEGNETLQFVNAEEG